MVCPGFNRIVPLLKESHNFLPAMWVRNIWVWRILAGHSSKVNFYNLTYCVISGNYKTFPSIPLFSFLCNSRFKWQLVSTMHNFLTISRERTFLLSWEVRRSMPVYEEANRIGSWLTGRRQECLFSKTWVKRELSPGNISNDWFNYEDVSH